MFLNLVKNLNFFRPMNAPLCPTFEVTSQPSQHMKFVCIVELMLGFGGLVLSSFVSPKWRSKSGFTEGQFQNMLKISIFLKLHKVSGMTFNAWWEAHSLLTLHTWVVKAYSLLNVAKTPTIKSLQTFSESEMHYECMMKIYVSTVWSWLTRYQL